MNGWAELNKIEREQELACREIMINNHARVLEELHLLRKSLFYIQGLPECDHHIRNLISSILRGDDIV